MDARYICYIFIFIVSFFLYFHFKLSPIIPTRLLKFLMMIISTNSWHAIKYNLYLYTDFYRFKNCKLLYPYMIIFKNWLIGMLLVSRSGLVEDDAVEVFYYYGFNLSSSFLM